ncbi:hypothetical protein K440DRAFT_674456 [Wilcoxina mikolae CBS 423.85]|nr:hypothetical protein K440DRAFT_674456 [Wilcoxina mikolae CBS 423.85]
MYSPNFIFQCATIIAALGINLCNARPAPEDLYPGIKYTDCSAHQIKHLQTAQGEMIELAEHALAMASKGKDYETNKGYTHYFRKDEADDLRFYKKAMELFSDTKDAKRPYSWEFKCHKDQKECDGVGHKTQSFMVTDARPEEKGQPRRIDVCPLFFNDERTKRSIHETDFCQHPESKKLMKWETGAHTLIHELTHLDSFGKLCGLPNVQDGDFWSHDTIDYGTNSPAGDARKLAAKPPKNPPKNTKPKPFENAENYAASATEVWVMAKCGVKDVPL